MPKTLVIRTEGGHTIAHFRVDQDYSSEDLARRVCRQMNAENFRINGFRLGDFVAAALCESEILDVEGSDLDRDVDIVDGVVVNARYVAGARPSRLPLAVLLEPAPSRRT